MDRFHRATYKNIEEFTDSNFMMYISFQKPQRLLPTNLFVVLYNFKARRADELDLK